MAGVFLRADQFLWWNVVERVGLGALVGCQAGAITKSRPRSSALNCCDVFWCDGRAAFDAVVFPRWE